MLDAIPTERLVVIPYAGHVPMWENPRAFNDALLAFFRTVESSGTRLSSPSFSWTISGWTNGIAHREAGRDRNIVLIHGLGMSSSYFVHFARALFERGWSPIAPTCRALAKAETDRQSALPSMPGSSRRGPARSAFATRSGSDTLLAATLWPTFNASVPIYRATSFASGLSGSAPLRSGSSHGC